MPELDLEPVTTRTIEERVVDKMRSCIDAQEKELERWETAYRLLFATNEARITENELLDLTCHARGIVIARLSKRIAYLEAQLKQTQPDEQESINEWLDEETPLGQQIDGGGEL